LIVRALAAVRSSILNWSDVHASSFIPGATPAATSHTEFRRPQDGSIIGRIAESGPDGVDAAVTSAGNTFGAQRKAPLAAGVGWLTAAAQAIRANATKLADLMSEDVGKPIRMARFQANRGAEFLRPVRRQRRNSRARCCRSVRPRLAPG
jgi:acyl-CoA reductase-like NAD-dependent aldehyde dehydrogenase